MDSANMVFRYAHRWGRRNPRSPAASAGAQISSRPEKTRFLPCKLAIPQAKSILVFRKYFSTISTRCDLTACDVHQTMTYWLQAMSFYPVSLYIAVFTTTIASPLKAATALSLFNSAGVVGLFAIGYFTDRVPYTRIMFISAVGCCLSAFLMWGFADTLVTIFLFAVVFGGLVSDYLTLRLSTGVINLIMLSRVEDFHLSCSLRRPILQGPTPNKLRQLSLLSHASRESQRCWGP